MLRTVVYDGPHLQQIFDKVAAKSPTRRAIAPAARRSIRREAEESIASATPHTEVIVGTLQDSYLARIAKYVPAETITLTMLGFGAFSPHGTAVWFWVGAGALTNVIYLAGLATAGPESQRPRWFFTCFPPWPTQCGPSPPSTL